MLTPSELEYAVIRQRQRELREQAVRAQLLARIRREARLAGTSAPRQRRWLARRVRADLARP